MRLVVVLAVGLSAPGGLAHAGGLFVGDTGTQSAHRAGAFVAKADDPSAIFFNPAGIARLGTRQFQVGANLINMSLEFDRFGTYANGDPFPPVSHRESFQPVPFIGLVWPLGKLVVGGGIFAPQGYPRRNFPDQVATPGGMQAAPQRYDSVEQRSLVAMPSLALGYQVNEKLSLGVRASWGFGSIESRTFVQGLPNEQEDPGSDSMTRVRASDRFVPSAGVGVHYRASDELELGFVLNSPAAIRARGHTEAVFGATLQALFQMLGGAGIMPLPDAEARCGRGGTADRLRACVNLDLPAHAAIGARFVARGENGRELGDIELDLRWENWSNASDIRVLIDGRNAILNTVLEEATIRHGLRDVYSIRLGAAARLPVDSAEIQVRAGVGYETGAAPVSWTRLSVDGNPRYMGATGVGVELGRFRLELGVSFFDSPLRQVRDVPLPDTSASNRVQPDAPVPLQGSMPPFNPINAGEYKASYFVASAGLTTWW